MSRPKIKVNTALKRFHAARSPRRKQHWAGKLKAARAELEAHEKEIERRKRARTNEREEIEAWPYEYGNKLPNQAQAEFMQAYVRYQINKPLSGPEVLRRFIDRKAKVVKRLKNAKGDLKIMLVIELNYLRLRIGQTLVHPQANFDLDPFLVSGDTSFE